MSRVNQSKGQVLLTGINGFVGMHIANALLQGGYTVVGTVRADSKTTYIKHAFRAPFKDGRLDFVVVPDLTANGAFDEALQSRSFSAVVHTATPVVLTAENSEAEILRPAILGTERLLEAVTRSAPSVKRVILLSSFMCISNPTKGSWPGHVYTEDEWNPTTYREGCDSSQPGLAYSVSKAYAEKAAWDFMKTRTPHFTLTTLCSPLVIGPPLQEISSLQSLNVSASELYGVFCGTVEAKARGRVWVDARDIALAHVRAIETGAAANQRYLVSAGNYSVQQILDFIWRRYPFRAQAKRVTDPGSLSPEGEVYAVDNSKSRRDLDLEYHSLEEALEVTFERYIQLEKAISRL